MFEMSMLHDRLGLNAGFTHSNVNTLIAVADAVAFNSITTRNPSGTRVCTVAGPPGLDGLPVGEVLALFVLLPFAPALLNGLDHALSR